MTQFRRAEKKELPKLTALWQACFGDEKEDVCLFWKALFDEIFVFAAWDKNQPAAMLCALPYQLVDDGGEILPAAYLYAVCTEEKYRGQGLCHRLMEFSEKVLKKEGFQVLSLVPAEKSLFEFYKGMGYQVCHYHHQYSTPAAKSHMKITKINFDAYENLRQMQLYGAFADYSVPLLRWQQNLSEKTGAGLYRLETTDGVYCAATEKWSDTLHVKELLPDCPEAAAALAASLGCKKALVRTQGNESPFGMAKSLCREVLPQFSYFALAFD